ncbi:MAG: hypothetical protein GTN45_00950, partial [Xanthomonadales bacterium]|nr:hypothetical protein [Xanthomonadales bacterium]
RRPPSEAMLREAALGVVGSFCARFTLSKQRAEYLVELLLTFERMREQREWKGAARVHFAQRASFDDALLLLEIDCLAAGEGEKVLAAWKGAARRRPARRKSAPRPRRRPRGGRRRRRPRRR